MAILDELLELERAGWDALSTGGDAAAAFYDHVLADEVLMLLPGGMVLDDRAAVIQSMQGTPWSSYELADAYAVPVGAAGAVLAYRARAVREGVEYQALVSSTYARDEDRWRLVLHQQTPV